MRDGWPGTKGIRVAHAGLKRAAPWHAEFQSDVSWLLNHLLTALQTSHEEAVF